MALSPFMVTPDLFRGEASFLQRVVSVASWAPEQVRGDKGGVAT